MARYRRFRVDLHTNPKTAGLGAAAMQAEF